MNQILQVLLHDSILRIIKLAVNKNGLLSEWIRMCNNEENCPSEDRKALQGSYLF